MLVRFVRQKISKTHILIQPHRYEKTHKFSCISFLPPTFGAGFAHKSSYIQQKCFFDDVSISVHTLFLFFLAGFLNLTSVDQKMLSSMTNLLVQSRIAHKSGQKYILELFGDFWSVLSGHTEYSWLDFRRCRHRRPVVVVSLGFGVGWRRPNGQIDR